MKQKIKGSAKAELKLTQINESATKKKKPFEYVDQQSTNNEKKKFSLKNLDPE